MKKFVLFGLIAVLSFGFAGCKTATSPETATDQTKQEEFSDISASVAEVVYQPAGVGNPELTKVIFEQAGIRSTELVFLGDQRAAFLVGTMRKLEYVFTAVIGSKVTTCYQLGYCDKFFRVYFTFEKQ